MLPQIGGAQFLKDISDIALDNGFHLALWDYRRPGTAWNYEQMGPLYWNTVLQMFSRTITSVTNNEVEIAKKEYYLSQNYPNPFNPETNINFSIPKNEFVTLKVYNILGKEIETLVNKDLSSGKYEIKINMSSYSSGVYFYTLKTSSYSITKKMQLVK